MRSVGLWDPRKFNRTWPEPRVLKPYIVGLGFLGDEDEDEAAYQASRAADEAKRAARAASPGTCSSGRPSVLSFVQFARAPGQRDAVAVLSKSGCAGASENGQIRVPLNWFMANAANISNARGAALAASRLKARGAALTLDQLEAEAAQWQSQQAQSAADNRLAAAQARGVVPTSASRDSGRSVVGRAQATADENELGERNKTFSRNLGWGVIRSVYTDAGDPQLVRDVTAFKQWTKTLGGQRLIDGVKFPDDDGVIGKTVLKAFAAIRSKELAGQTLRGVPLVVRNISIPGFADPLTTYAATPQKAIDKESASVPAPVVGKSPEGVVKVTPRRAPPRRKPRPDPVVAMAPPKRPKRKKLPKGMFKDVFKPKTSPVAIIAGVALVGGALYYAKKKAATAAAAAVLP